MRQIIFLLLKVGLGNGVASATWSKAVHCPLWCCLLPLEVKKYSLIPHLYHDILSREGTEGSETMSSNKPSFAYFFRVRYSGTVMKYLLSTTIFAGVLWSMRGCCALWSCSGSSFVFVHLLPHSSREGGLDDHQEKSYTLSSTWNTMLIPWQFSQTLARLKSCWLGSGGGSRDITSIAVLCRTEDSR